MIEPEQNLKAALAKLRAGDLAGAERQLVECLNLDPKHAPTLHWLGFIAGRAGRDEECISLLTEAIAFGDPAQKIASNLLLAAAHRRKGRPAEAENAYRALLDAAPDAVEALTSLGLLLLDLGRSEEALDPLLRATVHDPKLALAHGALATAHHALGNLAAAEESAKQALALAPGDPIFTANLAVIRNAQGGFRDAANLCQRALTNGEEPRLLNTLGIALKELGDLYEGAKAFERATARRPEFVDALYNLANARKDQGRTDDALSLFRQVVTLSPHLAAARFALCMAHLPPLYRDEAELNHRRSLYTRELSTLIGHAEVVGAAKLAAGIGSAQPFYLSYQGRNDRDLQLAYGALVCRAMAEAFDPVPLAPPPLPGEKLRIGIVCGYLRDHSVWRLPTRGWIEGLDASRFELIAYHTSPLCDQDTVHARALFDRFVQGPHPIDTWRAKIAADAPHALIFPEIGMDPVVAQLAAMRLAAVQYGSWGHPVTSGYPTIDYFLSSAAMEPLDGDDHYTEQLVRLPGLSTPMRVTLAPQIAETGRSQSVTYWCGQSLYKFLPEHDAAFAAIAQRVPNCEFVFLEFPGSKALTERFQQRLTRVFADAGLDADQYCQFLPRMDGPDYRSAIAAADIVLDSIGWSGCNSLLDALAFAKPIVTCPGTVMRSRHGAAILQRLGLTHAICDSVDRYIEVAAELGLDRRMRDAMQASIASRLSRLSDQDIIPALEAHIIFAVSQAGVENASSANTRGR